MEAIIVGFGFAGGTIWGPILKDGKNFSMIGVVDLLEAPLKKARGLLPGIWTASNVKEISDTVSRDTVVFVVTPDHWPVIVDLVELGFKNLVVEKPLVSHQNEIHFFETLIQENNLVVYTIDHYYQKFLALEFALGRMRNNDPRVDSLSITGDHGRHELPVCLGEIEGVTYTNIEAGDLGIPYLNTHEWVEKDPKIGGIIRDLGPHALSPLTRCGLIDPTAKIQEVSLLRLTPDRTGLMPVRNTDEIEMFVRTTLTSKEGVTANITFGKVPFQGKERSLAVRAANGVLFAGLARGQSSVVMTDDRRTTRISLRETENQVVVKEAKLFFDGKLSDFDGNMTSAITALEIGQKIRKTYYESLK